MIHTAYYCGNSWWKKAAKDTKTPKHKFDTYSNLCVKFLLSGSKCSISKFGTILKIKWMVQKICHTLDFLVKIKWMVQKMK